MTDGAEVALADGDLTLLLQWLDALPDALVRSSHVLATCKGMALLLADDLKGSLLYASAAAAASQDTASAAGQRLWLALSSFQALSRGDFVYGVRLRQEALAVIGDDDPDLRAACLFGLAAGESLTGNKSAAQRASREADLLMETSDHHTIAAVGPYHLVQVLLPALGRRRDVPGGDRTAGRPARQPARRARPPVPAPG
jgi:ATP/maltotriose-dependent transcriptional regulator MalT